MRFCNREKEIETLQQIEKSSKNFAQMTIVVGRRRIGKTELLKRVFTASPVLYFFVERKTEFLLCEEFSQEIRAQLIETKQFSAIGSYWDRRGENEIDIIAENEMEKRLVFYEVKRNERRINLSVLEKKASEMVKKYPDFEVEYKKLSLDRM